MDYETLIDPTNIATVASYLRNPRSPIHFLLNVRERALLAPLAAELAAQMEQPSTTGREVTAAVEQHLMDRAILLSPRPSRKPVNARVAIDIATLPAEANCEVIYLPPFYLAHTPGLFEGSLARNTLAANHRPGANRAPGFRIKL
jgi:hypothetical protein